MGIRSGGHYHLPDGTLVIARAADTRGALRFESLTGTPLYHYVPDQPGLYRLIFNSNNHVYYAAYCDLTLEDLIPDLASTIDDLFDEVEKEHPNCPTCRTPMVQIVARPLYTLYRCPNCHVIFEI